MRMQLLASRHESPHERCPLKKIFFDSRYLRTVLIFVGQPLITYHAIIFPWKLGIILFGRAVTTNV